VYSDNPDAIVSLRGIGRLTGICQSSLVLMLKNGELPPASGAHPGGWPYWRRALVEQWVDDLSLPRCPECGLPLKRLDKHVVVRHGRRMRSSEVLINAEGATPRPMDSSPLTSANVASILGISLRAAQNLMRRGDLPAMKSANRFWITDSRTLATWIERRGRPAP
jgi:hypothetical protein